ncbi:uncharacterized protein MELLADRAFT_85951 [Melampsora larici-populina 98AG31]|uniref:Uncharacterized protein n=1 Tax=Melampsora larici-populina (strain 98AG31 / pathotype 3-4-7) TaxID=747676 RepID=F4RK95_MELLP|nr:uncharacterized protein MELLADRAFT_85951 [Melampsora larici-populina 98AG31]EGG07220.1 hypothetical protein MELLADRAFT_85951 [Melampsora larici-populina 98AG31]
MASYINTSLAHLLSSCNFLSPSLLLLLPLPVLFLLLATFLLPKVLNHPALWVFGLPLASSVVPIMVQVSASAQTLLPRSPQLLKPMSPLRSTPLSTPTLMPK